MGILKYLKIRKKIIAVLGVVFFLFIFITYLTQGNMKDILYAAQLNALFLAGVAFFDYMRCRSLLKALGSVPTEDVVRPSDFPEPETPLEEEALGLIVKLSDHIETLRRETATEHAHHDEYYVLWVHQIKTPITAMNLMIQSMEPSELKSLMGQQLFKIEEYATMALSYIRIGSIEEDLDIREHSLDPLISKVLRKYAILFVSKKDVALKYEKTSYRVVTDEKWFGFMVEQILSNAIKYTRKGEIRLYVQEDVLYIEDTGIGIQEEDIPRVFSKGFTGFNGRLDAKSTGLGLFLCNRIANKLSHPLTITSEVGKGTKVGIGLKRMTINNF